MLRYLSILLFVCSALPSSAQYFYYDSKYYDNDMLFEAGVSAGIMKGVTDVGERKGNSFSPGTYDWKSAKLNETVYLAFLYKSIVEGRLELTKGAISGTDSSSNIKSVRSRNLNYKSSILELSLLGSFHPMMLLNGDHLPSFSPYVIGGISVFSFYPKTFYEGQWISLRPLNLEGQNCPLYPERKQYNLRTISAIAGVGLKYELNAKFNLRIEGLYRFSNSDYLDDVSTTYVDCNIFNTDLQKTLAHRYTQTDPSVDRTGKARGKSTNNDNFFTLNFKIGFVIGRTKIPINYAPNTDANTRPPVK